MAPPKLVGGVSRRVHARRLEPDEAPAAAVASIAVSRGLASGKLDVVWLEEADLARVVAEGAAVLMMLARDRAGR